MSALFISGASGFVGRALLRSLPQAHHDIRCLTRHPDELTRAVPPRAGWQYVAGSLEDPRPWETALSGCDTVLHLAAATGKEPRNRYYSVNLEGTRLLLEAARRAGVERFLYVSSIAAGFPDRRHYHYAQSKLQAEVAVKASPLDYLILRPTMVLGPGSPVLEGLIKLAGGPAAVVFGAGRVRVQPIHVEDLSRMLVALLERRPFGRLTLEAGGPELLPLTDLLRRIRQSVRGRSGPLVHLPLGLIRALLALVEPALFSVLPLTAGQLALFANDGVAEDAGLPGLAAPRLGIDAMLAGVSPNA